MFKVRRLLHFRNQKGNVIIIVVSIINTLITVGIGFLLYKSHQKSNVEELVDSANDAASESDSGHGGGGGHGVEGHGKSEGVGGGGHGSGGHGSGGHGGGGHGSAVETKKKVDYGRIINLEQFIINLSNPGVANLKYVRVNISVEVGNSETEDEVNAKMPQVRNIIIDIFNSKRSVDINTSENRDLIKDEIKNALNGILVNGKIKGVYYTNFAVTG